MILVVATEPPTFPVKTLFEEERVFDVVRLVTERLVTVASIAESAEMVVVAKVEFPSTTSLPVVVAFPVPSTVNADVADHVDPFQ